MNGQWVDSCACSFTAANKCLMCSAASALCLGMLCDVVHLALCHYPPGVHTVEGTVAGGRAAHLTKQREKQQQQYELGKQRIKDTHGVAMRRIL